MRTDLRIVKTHQHIRTALVELLQKKPFMDVAVQDILDIAQVNRSTFYKYYSGKSDLAGKMIDDFKAEYASLLHARFSRSGTALLLREVGPLMFQRRHLLLALWRVETRSLHLHRDMHEMLREQFSAYARSQSPTSTDWAYQATLFATLALTTARYFLEQDRPIPLTELPEQWQQMLSLIKLN